MTDGPGRMPTRTSFLRSRPARLFGFAVLALAMLELAIGAAEGQLPQNKEAEKEKAPAVPKAARDITVPRPAPAPGIVLPPLPAAGLRAAPAIAVPGMAVPAVRALPAPVGLIQGRVLAVQPPPAGQAGLQFVDVQQANVAMFEQQIGPQMRQLYRSELHFVRAACNLNKSEYDQLSKECEPALKSTTTELAKMWNGPGAIRTGADNNPRALLSKEMARYVSKALPPEKAALYQKEVVQREEAQKKTIVTGLVAKLDGILLLNASQRTKVEQILKDHWKEYAHEPRILMQGNRFFPRIPDEQILAVLTEAQRDEWNRIPKGNINYGLNFNFVQGFDEVDVIDEVELVAPIAPPPPIEKNAKLARPGPKS